VVAQEAARRLRPGGAVVTFSSSVVRLRQPSYAAYAAGKGAVEAMTLVLARELRGRDGRRPGAGRPGRSGSRGVRDAPRPTAGQRAISVVRDSRTTVTRIWPG
jgi:NAD(P)-dependent dehydrogenase (short-subunit alcohol dehydrogenase family)